MKREIRFILTLLVSVQVATCAVNRKALVEKYNNVTPTRFEGAVAVVLQQEEKSTVDDKGEAIVREGFARTKILDRRAMDCAGQGEDTPNCRIVRAQCYVETWDKIDLIEARTITPQGEVIELAEADFKDQAWTTWDMPDVGQRCLVYQLKGVTPGAIIEERYRRVSTKIIGIRGFIIGSRDPVLEAKYILDAPEDYKYRWKVKNIDIKPTETLANGRLTRTWIAREVPALQIEEGMVPVGQIIAQVKVANENISAYGEFPACRSVKSWEDLGQCWLEMIQPKQEVTPIVREIAEEIMNKAKTETERLKAIWKYMNQNIRYVAFIKGKSGMIPLSVDVVCSKKYGDCKAVSGLISVLCREMGITADPVIIGTRSNVGEVDMELPGFFFDHSIARVEADGKVYYMDATNRDMSFDTIGSANQGVPIVVARPGAPFVDHVPVQSPEVNSTDKKLIFTPSPDGSVNVKFSAEFRGNMAAGFRYASHSLAGDKFKRYISSGLGRVYNQIKEVKVDHQGKEDNEKPFRIEAVGVLPNALQKTGRNVTFEVKDIFGYGLTGLFRIPKRRYTLDLGNTSLSRTRFEVIIPKGMKPVGVPRNIMLENEYLAVERLAQIENDRIVAQFTAVVKQLQIPPEQYTKVRKDFLKMLDSKTFIVMFEPTKKKKKKRR